MSVILINFKPLPITHGDGSLWASGIKFSGNFFIAQTLGSDMNYISFRMVFICGTGKGVPMTCTYWVTDERPPFVQILCLAGSVKINIFTTRFNILQKFSEILLTEGTRVRGASHIEQEISLFNVQVVQTGGSGIPIHRGNPSIMERLPPGPMTHPIP